MSIWGGIALLMGALAAGLIADYLVDVAIKRDWILSSLAAAVGAYVGSETLGWLSSWGPSFQGFRLVPGLLGALTIGVAIEGLLRWGLRARSSRLMHGHS
jgi:uncharacterized membrane protein YeaQ/YmgE (transglycosylase-associated protein family)